MSASKLPPFKSLLKASEVEDPFHRWVHRPIAYAFIWAIWRTRLTPNHITLMGLIVGIASGVLFLIGGSEVMLIAGLLFWTSALLDDADGMLARAKNMHSQLGRAFDGSADMIVGAATVFPAFIHLWIKDQNPWHLALMVPAIVASIVHFNHCDFYREIYLKLNKPTQTRGGEDVKRRLAEIDKQPWVVRFALTSVLVPYTKVQHASVRLTNKVLVAEPEDLGLTPDPETARIWRKHNAGPMRVWAMISHAPHNEWMAFCAMVDRLDIYLWVRVVAMNVVFLFLVFWQKRATRRTLQELELAPSAKPAAADLPAAAQ